MLSQSASEVLDEAVFAVAFGQGFLDLCFGVDLLLHKQTLFNLIVFKPLVPSDLSLCL
jgi:hypothetical protein